MLGWLSQGAASGAIVNVTVPGVQADVAHSETATPYVPSAVGMPVIAPAAVITIPGGPRFGLVTVNVPLPGSLPDTGWLTVPFSSRFGTTAAEADPAAGPASPVTATPMTASIMTGSEGAASLGDREVNSVCQSRMRVMLSPDFANVCATRGACVPCSHDHLE